MDEEQVEVWSCKVVDQNSGMKRYDLWSTYLHVLFKEYFIEGWFLQIIKICENEKFLCLFDQNYFLYDLKTQKITKTYEY